LVRCRDRVFSMRLMKRLASFRHLLAGHDVGATLLPGGMISSAGAGLGGGQPQFGTLWWAEGGGER